jgi:hypothetical protein
MRQAMRQRKPRAALAAVPPTTGVLPGDRYPVLSELIDRADGAPLRRELEELLGHPVRSRAPRRPLKRIARLRAGAYDEVVLLKDLSASGARLLVPADQPLDIHSTKQMELVVRLPPGRLSLPVSVVRVCGQDRGYLDLGFRFLMAESELEALIPKIRSQIFGA